MLSAAFEKSGYILTKRQQGRRFVALEFSEPGARPQSVRVVTDRGIALALDGRSGSLLSPPLRYGLVTATGNRSSDAGRDELLLVMEYRGALAEPCLRPFEVLASGHVVETVGEPAATAADSSPATDACLELREPSDGQGQPAWVRMQTVDGLPMPTVPVVPNVLQRANGQPGATDHGAGHVDSVLREAVAARRGALTASLEAQDAVTSYRLAVELAWLAARLGASAEAQRAALQAVFDQLHADRRETGWEQAIMARVREGW